MSKKFYITTPIYYSSGKPHIGHAFTTILADVIARYKRLNGYDVVFQTGLDEHGQKIQNTAFKNKIDVKEMLKQNADVFKDLWKKLNIDYTTFVRTSNSYHKEAVQKCFTYLLEKGFIYLDKWTGYYCISCEEPYAKSQIKKNSDGKLVCNVGHELTYREEESYFLKISKYRDWILKFFNSHPDFVIPKERITELKNNFIDAEEGLTDLSVSRTNFEWGIKIKENDKHVIYVWLDALLSYVTGLGYLSNNDKLYQDFWNNDKSEKVHLMSKEIIRFHCIYWPIMLEMWGLKLPSKIISHGWIITKEGKMSKSIGNVIDPMDYINDFGADALRYFLIKEISYSKDGVFSHDLFLEVFNTDLANNYGNMITRVSGMLKKYFNNVVPNLDKSHLSDLDKQVLQVHDALLNNFPKFVDEFKISELISAVQGFINTTNKYIEQNKPWALIKENKTTELKNCLNILFTSVVDVVCLLKPILIDTTNFVSSVLNIEFTANDINKDWKDHIIKDCQPIFLRREK